jgi:ubiquinol-cytochrome c reductase core subunit 2
LAQQAYVASAANIATTAAHSVAFHTGLGTDLNVLPQTPLGKYVSAPKIAAFSKKAYAKSNIAVVSVGTSSEELSKWTGEFFADVPAGSALTSTASKYYGGEVRLAHSASNSSIVIAFPGSSSAPGSSSYKPETSVLAALLGGDSTIKWSPGFSLLSKVEAANPGVTISTSPLSYSDSGLLAITLNGPSEILAKAAKDVVAALKTVSSGDISKELLTKAVALAKFQSIDAEDTAEAQILSAGIHILAGGKTLDQGAVTKDIGSVTASTVSKSLKTLLDGKASVAVVGDLYALPWAEELGLKV